MIPKECKRLAEVDFPIAVVSKHAAREKSIRHGHPSTLHLWWARRPLAACRAVLLGLLLPDPCDEHCPKEFRTKARELLKKLPGRVRTDDLGLRQALLKFIGDFANWDHAANATFLEVGRGLVKAAHGEETPLVVDPFAGGGSIPLEALRLGCEAFASDLNPVACLILKVMLEDIPRHGPQLAEELRRVGAEVKKAAEEELANFYPPDSDGARPIAYLWARTVRCESPNCGAEIPLMRSFWLCKKASRRRALRYKVIKPSGTSFQPVNPWKHPDLGIQSRHLPHLQTPDATYFVTFRCAKGIELPEQARDLVLSAVTHWNGKKIDLDAAVVMPDHVHMIFRIVGQASSLSDRQDTDPTLSSILHSIKSYSANEVNKLLKRKGTLWLDESFDHIIRHGEEWEEKVEYIRQNAVKKGLAGKAEDYRWLWLRHDRQDACPTIEFEIFEPKSEKNVPNGTVTRANATCPCCQIVLPAPRVRAQLTAQHGGADVVFDGKGRRVGGSRLLAVVTIIDNTAGRQYRLATDSDYAAVYAAQQAVAKLPKGAVPDEPLPPIGTLGFRVQRYGMLQWGDLFTARQKVALSALARAMKIVKSAGQKDVDHELLGVAVSRCSSFWSSLNMWVGTGEFVANVFGRQALPIIWDFCEVVPTTTESGGFDGAVDWVSRVVEAWPGKTVTGQVQAVDARQSPLPSDACSIWFTDPPYYDAVPYADLSDFFFVWLKRALPEHSLLRDPFDPTNPLTPKIREVVQDEVKLVDGQPKNRAFFEETIAKTFAEGRRVLKDDGVGCVVFAHKTTEGWEALLSGVIKGGWVISGSWPIATERPGRLRSQDSAALATSVHLICRPRPQDAPVGDWGEILRELPKRVGDWMERLQGEGVRGADLVFACIGPALEIFSRYRRVETADGREVKLAEYLEKVWEVVGRTALEQVLGSGSGFQPDMTGKMPVPLQGGLEEDARLTALFLWTLQSSNGQSDADSEEDNSEDEADEEAPSTGKVKGFSLVFDVARRFAQPLGIDLSKWEGRIIETDKGVVRLLPVTERAKQLFGQEGAETVADWLEHDSSKDIQQMLFPELEQERAPRIRGRGRRRKEEAQSSVQTAKQVGLELPAEREATTLDRVHAAMLLQAGGQTNGLRALIKAEQERGPDFLRLANAFSALYPPGSEEKRLLDAMLLAVPR